jgi:hypothetical protein
VAIGIHPENFFQISNVKTFDAFTAKQILQDMGIDLPAPSMVRSIEDVQKYLNITPRLTPKQVNEFYLKAFKNKSMKEKKFIFLDTLKTYNTTKEISCRAITDTKVNELICIDNSPSIYRIIRIESYRKVIDQLPSGYTGIISINLISGDHPNFISGDIFYSI